MCKQISGIQEEEGLLKVYSLSSHCLFEEKKKVHTVRSMFPSINIICPQKWGLIHVDGILRSDIAISSMNGARHNNSNTSWLRGREVVAALEPLLPSNGAGCVGNSEQDTQRTARLFVCFLGWLYLYFVYIFFFRAQKPTTTPKTAIKTRAIWIVRSRHTPGTWHSAAGQYVWSVLSTVQ